MTITTMEELEAVPVDSEVEVQDNGVWTRVANGLRAQNDTVLALSHFSGAVKNSLVKVRDSRPVEPGMLYHNPGYTDVTRYMWVVLRVNDDGSWNVATLMRSRFRNLDRWPAGWAERHGYVRTPEAQQPDYVALVQEMGMALLEERERKAPHPMSVTISGTVSTDAIRKTLGASPEVNVAPSAWNVTVQIVKQGAGCLCDTVTREELVGHIPAGASADWTFRVSH